MTVLQLHWLYWAEQYDESGRVCMGAVDGLLKILPLLLASKGKKSGQNWLMMGSFV
jgi:hypothetical protein